MIGTLLALLPWTKNINDTVNTNLNATVSSRASQTTVDTINGKVDVATSTRASQTDMTTVKTNTDVKTSTRAPASTALSTSTWTAGRAANLDDVDMPISAITPIQSIQSGAIANASPTSGATSDFETRYTDVTISSVNTSKCIILVTGYCTSSTNGTIQAAGRLTSSTNLRIGVAGHTGSTYGSMLARWQVIELK